MSPGCERNEVGDDGTCLPGGQGPVSVTATLAALLALFPPRGASRNWPALSGARGIATAYHVLGGWSFGGDFVRLYAKRYPNKDLGFVTVDGTPIGLPDRLMAEPTRQAERRPGESPNENPAHPHQGRRRSASHLAELLEHVRSSIRPGATATTHRTRRCCSGTSCNSRSRACRLHRCSSAPRTPDMPFKNRHPI